MKLVFVLCVVVGFVRFYSLTLYHTNDTTDDKPSFSKDAESIQDENVQSKHSVEVSLANRILKMKCVIIFCLVAIFAINGTLQCPPVGYSASSNPETQNLYYFCKLNKPPSTYMMYVFTCPGGQIWDQAIKKCKPKPDAGN
ncbi:unnamed protein product [Allacma fusca]|uniref:Chitin-binding type-2 domain-containing protein n=1 Tax=Allacma fusca TaxID=39272 RepID=A0A8J2PHI3_9HEXA|nr:unnamed protein product [Allacma fusca]